MPWGKIWSTIVEVLPSIANIALVVVTGFLYHTTRRYSQATEELKKSAKDSAETSRKLVKSTQKLAEAARDSAEASRTLLLSEKFRIIDDMFNTCHYSERQETATPMLNQLLDVLRQVDDEIGKSQVSQFITTDAEGYKRLEGIVEEVHRHLLAEVLRDTLKEVAGYDSGEKSLGNP